MFKRIATSTLIVGAVMSIMPALASAEDFHRDRDRGRERYGVRERRDFRDRDYRVRDYRRGFYDRFGYWHWY